MVMQKTLTAMILVALLTPFLQSQNTQVDQDDRYALSEIAGPKDQLLEVGGIAFLPSGEMVVSTRRGQVWITTDPTKNDGKVEFHLFAEGLQDCLGLNTLGEEILVVQRGELSRLVDSDGDRTADIIETVTNAWGVSGNYHEYAFGLPRDRKGNHYVSLNVAFMSPKWWLGTSSVPYRGWVLKVQPDGTTTPFATGFRSPCGIGRNLNGEIFVSDNQGDWMAACPIFHVEEGKFYGHPAGLRWTKDFLDRKEIPSQIEPPSVKREQAAVWLPYNWSRSAGQMVWDDTNGAFGPFTGQMFISELTNGNILRVYMEKIRGQYQGAVFMFKRRVGSAVRLKFAADGSLILGRTNRGWGGLTPGDGLARLKWDGQVPFDMHRVHIKKSGFKVLFTQPLAEDLKIEPSNVSFLEYDYNYWWEYGSPEVHKNLLAVESITIAEDRMSLTCNIPALRSGKVVRAIFTGLKSESGTPLSRNEFHYTVNHLPEGPKGIDMVAKTVQPPAAKESPYEGWVYLNKISGEDRWAGQGWQEVKHNTHDIVLDPQDGSKVLVVENANPNLKGADGQSSPISILSRPAGEAQDKVSKVPHGAIETWFDVFIPQKGSSSIFFQGRYEINFADDKEKVGTNFAVVSKHGKKPATMPHLDLYKGPGEWHVVHMKFSPPRFDDQGKKFIDACFEDVSVDGTLLHEHIDLDGCSMNAPVKTESAKRHGIVWRNNKGQCAFRRSSMKQIGSPLDDKGWVSVFNGTHLDNWKTTDTAEWRVEKNVIIGSGKMGHLFSPRGDYRNFELKARVQINDKGNSGLYFRTTYGPGWPKGYEAQVNSTFKDPVKSGSLYSFDLINCMFVEPGVWFDYYVHCRDVDEGVHITIKLNGLVVVDYVDTKKTHATGHIALQQHHDGSIVRIRDLMIREH
ncbi:MAG: glucose/arabinose dehydrogenase [Planctomycetota bacterium]|jgi:glucose/arabinose dehydrogenase